MPRSPKNPDDESQWESSWSKNNLADCVHPLVRAHPETGIEALYLNLNRITKVHGLDEDQSVELLNRLQECCEAQPGAILTHKWREGDFVIFDNAVVQHRAEGKHTMKPGERRYSVWLPLFSFFAAASSCLTSPVCITVCAVYRVNWQMMCEGERPVPASQWVAPTARL